MRIVLLSVREKLVGKLARHRTDNMKAEHFLHVSNPKPKLHSEGVAT